MVGKLVVYNIIVVKTSDDDDGRACIHNIINIIMLL